LKFVTFTVHPEDEDVNNNIHPSPPQRVIYFSLVPLPEFPGQKYKKKMRKCVGKLHLIVT
jgi:hypothetical protein